jgi:uncharacterized membrane protein
VPVSETGAGTETPTEAPSQRSDRAALIALGTFTLTWIAVFGWLVYLRQDRLGSFDFDMGIHDQSVWLLAHFRGFLTVRGLQVFGHHATVGYFLFVPFYWLGAGAQFLNQVQVVVAALGVIPVFLLARYRTSSAWLAAALGAALLFHPAMQFFMQELFHPEVVAITPLFCAYYCSVRRSWRWFALWAVLAVAWKEDVALAVLVIGLLIAWRGDRKVGFWTAGLSLAWFLSWGLALFPLLDHGKIQSAGLYTDVGGSPGGMIRTAFTHPGRITSHLTDHDASEYGWKLLAPFGFLALAAPALLLIGVPQAVLNLVTNVPWTKTITFHYAALPLVAVTIAMVEGVGWIACRWSSPTTRLVLGAVVLGSAVATSIAWGPSPIGAEYRTGLWPLDASPRLAAARGALDHVPSDAAVSATYNLVPQLAHRADIYTFPNPWRSVNFGIDGWPRRSPRGVAYLVLDRAVLDVNTKALFDHLVTSGKFRVVYDMDDWVVARRVNPSSG